MSLEKSAAIAECHWERGEEEEEEDEEDDDELEGKANSKCQSLYVGGQVCYGGTLDLVVDVLVVAACHHWL